MLYSFFDWLAAQDAFPGVGVFRYLTFRAVLAALFSLVITIGLGGWLIRTLRRRLIGESIRDVGPQSHHSKKGTPTMGGLMIVAAIVIPTLLWADLTSAYVWLMILATLWMGLVGFVDDYIKVFKKDKRGLQGKFKLAGQVLLGLTVALVLLTHPDFRGKRSKIDFSGQLRSVPQLLQEAGFRPGDRIVRADGKALADPAYKTPLLPYAEYRIAHHTSPTEPSDIRTLEVPARLRQAVAEEIFGFRDLTFVTKTNVPFFKNSEFDYASLAFWTDDPTSPWVHIIYVVAVIFIVTAVSNGANITDGIDGLAAGVTAIAAVALGIFAYVSGNAIYARYLNISFIPGGGELFVVAAALVMACVGFLWFNAHPAQVFMGDTGSLALGSAVGVLALMVKKELLLPLICGVYLVESLSVIVQVSYFKYTKRKYGQGRRIFRMSPLHHHFELGGMHEAKIVTRFWIVSILLAILAFSTLKLR